MSKKKSKLTKPYKFQSLSQIVTDKYGQEKLKYTTEKGNEETDSFSQIFHSLRVSPSFKDLSSRQRDVYGVAVDLYDGARNRPKDVYPEIEEFSVNNGRMYFFLNHYLLCEVYGIYGKNSTNMYKDIQALIDHGFIERVGDHKGKYTQNMDDERKYERNVYTYSDRWRTWKPPKK